MIKPKPGLAHGTVITNIAKIVFETNTPLWTPMVTNTLDLLSPSTTITTSNATLTSTTFTVTWTAVDPGSGIEYYDVYRRDGTSGAWLAWVTNTVATSAAFTGVNHGVYQFYVVATDHVGNRMAAPPNAQLTATITQADDPRRRRVLLPQVMR